MNKEQYQRRIYEGEAIVTQIQKIMRDAITISNILAADIKEKNVQELTYDFLDAQSGKLKRFSDSTDAILDDTPLATVVSPFSGE